MTTACTACLDSQECWPCLGKGWWPGIPARIRCSSCSGAGVCTRCVQVSIPVPRAPEPEPAKTTA